MATQNSINKSTQTLTVDPASGDSYIQYSTAGVAKWRTGNDATDDSYRISTGSLGTSDSIIMSSSNITKPLQCSFSAYKSSTSSNVTGDNTKFTIIEDTVSWNIGSGYDNSTGIFTAPETAIYLFTGSLDMLGLTSAITGTFFSVVTSNAEIFGDTYNTSVAGVQYPELNMVLSVIAQMESGDTAYLVMVSGNGPKVVDVFGSASKSTFFSGTLIS